MAQIIKPPTPFAPINKPTLFLAGTIDDGRAENWQVTAEKFLQSLDILILNPRRDDWDSSWVQSIENPVFREQVTWELDGQARADLIMMYFAPGSQSPITLLELGLFAHSRKLYVCCPPGFWRKGNVEVVCQRYHIPLYTKLDSCLTAVEKQFSTGN